ncbi:carbohydrate kinase family protein [Candidatus Kaiserbacteria bacterium]|nr:carbohydrate kinase family protein [Candidatus Kaiserbacteria bacterium]
MPRIFVSGSVAYDRIMSFPGLFKDHFLADKLHNINVSFQIDSLVQHFGGTAGNIAYNLAFLGEKPTILANTGKDFSSYAEHLAKNGISSESLQPIEEMFTSVAHIVTDRGDNQIAAFYMGAGEKPYGKDFGVEKGDIVIVGAGNIVDMEMLPSVAKKAGATFFFDPGQAIPALSPEVLRSGMENSSALFVNDYELAMILQKTGWDESEIAARVSVLLVTVGKEGSRVITKDGEIRVPAVPAKEVKDPTGAGDAYRAGYIKGFKAGKNPEECAKLASAVAVYAVESLGTQDHLFTIEELKKRYQSAYKEALEI